MVKRLLIHVRNLNHSICWIYFNYRKFQRHLETKGFYSIEFYKIWLWKESAKYFKVYNVKGDCFFIKLKSKESVSYESKVLNYISGRRSNIGSFYPKVIEMNISEFNYLIYENVYGDQISKNSLNLNSLIQIKEILAFFKRNGIIHRDIRPHNIIVDDTKIILLDFEHCVIDGENCSNDDNLNNDYRPKPGVWDDAYSFKKIIENYCPKSFHNDKVFLEICNMVGKYEHA